MEPPVRAGDIADDRDPEEGGDPPCWAHLFDESALAEDGEEASEPHDHDA